MRRMLILFLVCAMVFTVCACRSGQPNNDDSVKLYYLRRDIVYGADDGVIAAEKRQYSGTDINALINAYLAGPQDPELVSPFPEGTRLIAIHHSGETIVLQLSEEADSLEGIDYILACACLCRTCFDLYGKSQVTVRIAQTDRSITMTPESLILSDDSDTIDSTIGTESREG